MARTLPFRGHAARTLDRTCPCGCPRRVRRWRLEGATSDPGGKEPLLGVTAGSLLAPSAPLEREVKLIGKSGVTALRAPFYWSVAQPPKTLAEIPAVPRRPLTRMSTVVPTRFAQTDHLVGRRVAGWNRAAAGRGRRARLGGRTSRAEQLSASSRVPVPRGLPQGSDRPLRAGRLVLEGERRRAHAPGPRVAALERARPPLLLVGSAIRAWYVRLARAGRRAIKGADPGARVVMGDSPIDLGGR